MKYLIKIDFLDNPNRYNDITDVYHVSIYCDGQIRNTGRGFETYASALLFADGIQMGIKAVDLNNIVEIL